MAAARAGPRISQRSATVVAVGQGLSDEHKQQRAALAGDGGRWRRPRRSFRQLAETRRFVPLPRRRLPAGVLGR